MEDMDTSHSDSDERDIENISLAKKSKSFGLLSKNFSFLFK